MTKIFFISALLLSEEKDAYAEDMEFGRQLLAGTNPVQIQILKVSLKS